MVGSFNCNDLARFCTDSAAASPSCSAVSNSATFCSISAISCASLSRKPASKSRSASLANLFLLFPMLLRRRSTAKPLAPPIVNSSDVSIPLTDMSDGRFSL